MSQRMSYWRAAILLGSLLTAGCNSPYIRTPNFAHPGTAAEQRADAERFDPYPDPSAGPEVVGGRPPGFTQPLTEPDWSSRYGRPGIPALPSPVPGPLPGGPIITTPYAPTAPPVYSSPAPSNPVQPRAPY